MSATCDDLAQRLLNACLPNIPLTRSEAEGDLLFTGQECLRLPRYLFSPKRKLWTFKKNEYCYVFRVSELNFDSLARCHATALEAGMARFDPAAKHSATHITAVIVCDTAQADALEALTRFKKRMGCPLSFKARLNYRLAAADLATGEVVCNRRARKFRSALLAQIALG